ncbi:hypothetical protein BDN72DRAFT_813017 [Pluteus cervinus]|uniref:Uncharacterized protein n=1 Tax=Pluteus cervinus TaxID=181527 RepID=A0ACD3B9C7_9AGAR|nr:hypothetical protein BDN72DRAFT_813017 [Pluteus cervinus]
MRTWLAALLCSTHTLLTVAQFLPLREYAGQSFFDGWDYYGFYDNTTWGNVTYLDQPDAVSQRLTYVNSAGNAVVKVDNTTNVADGPLVYRNSIRLTTKDAYGVGTLVIFDALHMPYGCSVWPSFWTLGSLKKWPHGGEIDIVEGINMMDRNQMALHTDPGCFQSPNPVQSGDTLETNCSLDRGCIVGENKPNSYGPGFAQAGGGVWATQWDDTGVFIWFWGRADIPDNIKSATSTSSLDVSTWGQPSASYPAAGCNIEQFFDPQQLVILITLCGVWAGIPDIYSSTCHTPKNSCYADNIIGPGSPTYDEAYFEIPYIRVYQASNSTQSGGPSATQSGASTVVQTVLTTLPAAQTTLPTLASGSTRVTYSITGLTLLSMLLFWSAF